MLPDKFPEFLIFLEKNLEVLELSSSTGFNYEFPQFDLLPFDYLDFAELEIENDSTNSRINCITHLKRAIECELDTFLHIFKIPNKSNNFPQKVEFAKNAGLFSSRSIEKLNKIRNKLEHQYSIPHSIDIENYFDIAAGFVHSIEGCIYLFSNYQHMDWHEESNVEKGFTGEININKQIITFIWSDEAESQEIKFDLNLNKKQYAYGLHIYHLICKSDNILSADYVNRKINKLCKEINLS